MAENTQAATAAKAELASAKAAAPEVKTKGTPQGTRKPTKTFRLAAGKLRYRGEDGELKSFVKGDDVDLTASQAKAWGDLLEKESVTKKAVPKAEVKTEADKK